MAPDSGFVAESDSVFVLRLVTPFQPMLQILTMQYASIVPREVCEQYGRDFRRHPVHTYTQEGLYQVCLRAGPAYGAVSTCREIRVLSATVGSGEVETAVEARYRVFPNPTEGNLIVQCPPLAGQILMVTLYNTFGQSVLQTQIAAPGASLSIQSLPAGVYWLIIREKGCIVHRQVCIKN